MHRCCFQPPVSRTFRRDGAFYAVYRAFHIGWGPCFAQRERWVPYEQPVKNDANGGFEQANVQGNWSDGQRFPLMAAPFWASTTPCTSLGDNNLKPRSVALPHESNRTYLDFNR